MKVPVSILSLLHVLMMLLSASLEAQFGNVENRQPVPEFDQSERLSPPKLTFFVIGAWGCGGATQQSSANAMAKRLGEGQATAVLTTGDNFLDAGVASTEDPQWDSKHTAMFPVPDFPVPFYPTLGARDHTGNPDAQVDYTWKQKTGAAGKWKMPGRHWKEVFRTPEGDVDALVIGLDTYCIVTGNAGDRTRQLLWLDSVLAMSQERWRIVVGYHPVFSNSRTGNTLMMMLHVKPLLEKHEVHAYFSGRDNNLQLLSPVRGVRYAVSGAFCRTSDTRWANNTLFVESRFGYLVCELNRKEMLLQFMGADSSVLYSWKSPL